MTNGKSIVGYYRVSTDRQGDSGLGLEAQEVALNGYRKTSCGRVLATYTEIESGRKSDRPELARALAHAKRSGATLVIAKLDRLGRNLHFITGLMDSGVDFAACDNPHANKLMIHMLVAFAEYEAEAISKRTKEALAAYKARGGLLGASRPECRNLTPEARKRGAKHAGEVAKRQADGAYTDLIPTMKALRESGATLQEIADGLNHKGHTTRRDKPWNPVQVMRVLKR